MLGGPLWIHDQITLYNKVYSSSLVLPGILLGGDWLCRILFQVKCLGGISQAQSRFSEALFDGQVELLNALEVAWIVGGCLLKPSVRKRPEPETTMIE
jgi:hypothetical protein